MRISKNGIGAFQANVAARVGTERLLSYQLRLKKEACRFYRGWKMFQNFTNSTVMIHYFLIKGFGDKRNGIYLLA